MIKTPQEYREKIKKGSTVQLPSGLECVIQPVPTSIILELTQTAEDAGTTLDQYLKSNFAESLDVVIPSSVVSPKVVKARKPGDPIDENALSVDELVIGDLNALFTEIVKISGLKQGDIDKFKSFPEQQPGNFSGPDGK